MVVLVLLTICIFLVFTTPNYALAHGHADPSLRFAVAEWAYEVRGEDDYDPNPKGEFSRRERGYAYLVVENFGVGQKDGFHFLQLNVDVALESQKGFRLFSQEDVLELEEWYLEPPPSTWFYIYVDIPWWAPKGVYKAIITVKDAINETSLEQVREITIH